MSRSVRYTSSPLLASQTPVWRSKFIVAMIALGFVGLGARAAYVQVYNNDFFLRQGEVRFTRTLDLPADRGKILDRNGLILASSVPAAGIWANPTQMDASQPAFALKLAQLAKLVGMSESALKARLGDGSKGFVWIRRQMDVEVGNKILALGLKGVYQRAEYQRQYPEGEAVAHIVGFTKAVDVGPPGEERMVLQGQEGVELAFDEQLAGQEGSRRVIKDRLHQVVEGIGETIPPIDGRDIQLSIDSKIQFFAYQKLRSQVQFHNAKGGSAVVLDARTGEILALANYPSYSPESRRNMNAENMRNRALTDVFEPGSTMKPFTVALALEHGLVRPTSTVDTNPGRLTITGSTITDTKNHGVLTVEEVIQKSSNVGTTKLAMQLSARDMWETFSATGFGQKPQLSFPGAVTGRLRPYKTWRPIEQATMSYGYGLSASLFQMARSYTVFANEGRIIPATMLKSDRLAVGVPVFSEKTTAQVLKMLQMAAGPGGTGQKAQTLGYSVGGKSGTARKQIGKTYAINKYRSWFTGLAPIDHPRIIVAVMIDEPSNGEYYGGLVAAPVFSEVVQQSLRILGVQPDMAVVPQIVADVVEESL